MGWLKAVLNFQLPDQMKHAGMASSIFHIV